MPGAGRPGISTPIAPGVSMSKGMIVWKKTSKKAKT
jgi:hypothetical protein